MPGQAVKKPVLPGNRRKERQDPQQVMSGWHGWTKVACLLPLRRQNVMSRASPK